MEKVKKSSKKQTPIETSPSLQSHPTREELYAMGKSLRDKCPRQTHAVWQAADNRPDPLALMEESNKGRIPQLVPIRHGRMLQSPFTFYRGAALNMAADLAGTPATGIRVQACGDCHLLNFGAYRDPRTARDLRHQRPGRDPPRPLGVGRETPGRQLRAGLPRQRLQRRRRPRCRAELRAVLSRTHGGIQRHAGPGRVVCEHRC